MADSDDDMPPLEYVGNAKPGTGNMTATPKVLDDEDDDMPPLEYVGTDASLGISLREGDNVILKGLSKNGLNGMTGVLQSFQKATKGRLPVKLDASGQMLAVKPENLVKVSGTQSQVCETRPKESSGLQTANAVASNDRATLPADGAMDDDDDDDELPPLEYIGASAQNGAAMNGSTGVPCVREDSDDEMPRLEYIGVREAQPEPPIPTNAEVHSKNNNSTKTSVVKDLPSQANTTYRPGDQVIIRGMRDNLNGQQGTIMSISDGFHVKLEKTGQVVQVMSSEHLHKIWFRGSGAGTMPPLQFVGQANGHPLAGGQQSFDIPRPQSDVMNGRPLAPGEQTAGAQPQQVQESKAKSEMQAHNIASKEASKSVIERWCEELQLPHELLTRLKSEDVTDPQELSEVGESDLASLTAGLKIGPKGRFLKAVKRMKALEAADLGSAASLC